MKANIKETNKLIAEFLGETKQPYDFSKFGYINARGDWKSSFFDNELKFHKDWNWLMEAVDKIESLGYVVKIQGISCSINKVLEKETIVQYVLGNKSKKIELVYTTIVSFIEKYNENNITNNSNI